jgi:3',5'-cyclic-AMP phosphodiesterase
MHSLARYFMPALLPLCSACLTPAADRAKRDEKVGQAESPAYSLRVKDGLAVVRNMSAERLALWQSAPALHLSLDVNSTDPIELDVNNTMLGARLQAQHGAAVVQNVGSTRGKRRHWRVIPARLGELTLELTGPNTDIEPFRFALMSDVQEAIADVHEVYAVVNDVPNLDFLLGAGDLTQQGERAQLKRFEQQLEGLTIPYYTTLGNHELGVDPPLFHEFFGRGSFSFVHRGARFTLVDSASATIDQRTYRWLTQWLTLGADQFHAIAMHIPPIDPTGTRNGSFASREEAVALFADLQKFDVDVTLYGHIHSFYDFDNAGIPAVISGGGGAIPERFDNIGRHVVVFEVDPEKGTFSKELVRVD